MAMPVLLAFCVHPKIVKIQNIYLRRTNFLIHMSEFKDGFLKLNLKKDKQRLEKVLLLLEATYDVTPTGREAAYDNIPRGREAAYDVTSRGREAVYEIIRGRREAAPEDTLAAFEEINAAFGRRDAAFERRLPDVDQSKIVSQHQPDKEMNDQFLQGAGIDQEERMNNQFLQGAGIDQEEGMNDQCLQDAGISVIFLQIFIK
jgi:hypothetical protein